LFRPSLAFNVLLEATLPTESAVAVAAPTPRAHVSFLVPQRGTVLAGTVHLARPPGTVEAAPTTREIEDYLAQLRAAIPGFDVGMQHVRRVFAGLLPARADLSADLAKREVLVDHGVAGGPQRLFSVSGVKYTTAQLVANRVLGLLGDRGAPAVAVEERELPIVAPTPLLTDARRLWSDDRAAVRAALLETAAEEAARSVDDVVIRRTNWATTEPDLERVRARVLELAPELRFVGDEVNA
jgi:glycerol-3-phosphate dehydrogenase